MITAEMLSTVGATKFRAVGAIIALLVCANASNAQSTVIPNCHVTPAVAVQPFDICQKVVDIFSFLSPQIGVALAGGNPMLGEGGTLGGPGKISASIHVTAVDGRIPKNSVQLSQTGAAVSSDYGAQRAPVPLPAVDAAIGLFKGMTVGLTNVGGVDLLVGAAYVPNVNKEPFSIRTEKKAYAFLYGVRVGILQESAAVPGMSFSYKERKFPTSNFAYTPNNDTLTIKGATLSSKSMRLVVAKRFVFIGFAAGVGRDEIEAKSEFSAVVNDFQPVSRLAIAIPSAQQKVTRNNVFGNLSFGLPTAQLVLEYGWSSAGTIQQTVNTFGGRQANEGYHYASLGFGFRL
ncbi:MAG: hypothetical protein ABJC26_07400 [Gemmatimonadaceae bacterium]